MGMDFDDLRALQDAGWHGYSADDTDIMFYIRYVGAQPSCLITVAGSGDITSEVGVSGSEAADPNFMEPGGTPGTIDVSDTNSDTMKKVVDIINNLSDYECWPVDSLPDEALESGGTGFILAITDQQAKDVNLAINGDTSARKEISVGVGAADHFFTVAGKENLAMLATILVTTATSYALKLYLIDDTKGTKVEAYSLAITAGTRLNYTAAHLSTIGVTQYGNRMVFMAVGGTNLAFSAGDSIMVHSRSTPLNPQHRGTKEYYEDWP